MRVPIVRLSELRPGTTASFDVPVDGERDRGILVRLASGELRAYVNRCRHANLPLDWGDDQFLDEHGQLQCRAHGARYAPEDGACTGGPCMGKKLRPIKVELEGPDELVIAVAVAHAAPRRPGEG